MNAIPKVVLAVVEQVKAGNKVKFVAEKVTPRQPENVK
jgi:hypothetical protein